MSPAVQMLADGLAIVQLQELFSQTFMAIGDK
jgi:hypothetical protein